MSKIVGRRPIEIKISELQNGYIPVFNSSSRLWGTISKNDFITGSATTSGSNIFIGTQTISGSLTVLQGITGSLLGTASYADNAWAIGGNIFSGSSSDKILGTLSDHGLSIYTSGSRIATFTNSGSFILGPSASNPSNALIEAKFTIEAGITSQYNLIKATSNINNYSQFSIQNQNSGSNASSDIVAVADNGSESNNYINLGINSSTFTGDSGGHAEIGGANDAYLYSTGHDLHIGNASNYPIQFFAGGANTNTNRKLQLDPSNNHQLTGSLNVSGSVAAQSFTGSLQGSSSYALTASYADNFTVGGTLTAQTIVAQTITSSVEFITGSTKNGSLLTNTHQFTGSVGITGSLEINGRNYINDSSSFDNRITTNSSSFVSFLGTYNNDSSSFADRIRVNSSSFADFSGSYINESASFVSRIVNNSGSISQLSSSYLVSSASFDTRALNNSGSIAQLSGSYLADSASFASRIINNSASIAQLSGSYLADSASFDTRISNNSASISSLSSSFNSFSGSYNTGSFTGSFIGRHTGSFSGSLYNLQNDIIGHIPFYSSSQVLADSIARQIDNGSGSFSIVINQNGVTTAAPEALYVWQPSDTSYNVISGKGNLNSYLQLNIQNLNNGDSASSDVVASANNATETANYVDMGINNENFTPKGNYSVGGANDSYLLSTGRHHYIGSATSGDIKIFTGADFADDKIKLLLRANNSHELTGSLSITEKLNVLGGVTASLQGTASWANNATTASYVENAQSASYWSGSITNAATASYVETAQTASYVLQAQSASYATTASSAPDYLPLAGGTLTGDLYAAGRTFWYQDLILGYGTTGGKITTDGTKYISIMPDYNVESARFWPNGNVTIQNAGTYVDNGFRLDVSGSGRFTDGLTVTGSLQAINGVTGSLLGTASYATQALSASYWSGSVINASTASYVQTAQTASYVLQAQSASYWSGSITNAATASYVLNAVSSSFASTASSVNILNQNVVISGSLTVTGSTNIIGNSGTTLLSSNADTLVFTGSLFTTGSIISTGSLNILGGVTGSLLGTASYATQALSASYWSGSIINAATASYVQTAQTASYVLNAVSASYTSTASYLNPIENSYLVLSQVSQSLNFADDTAAAAGGVPLGGLYRNGNFILIRIV